MEALAHPVSMGRNEGDNNVARFQSAFAERMTRFNEAANTFLRCWSIAELHFDADVEVLLKEIWSAKAKLQVDHMMYLQGIAVGTNSGADHEALFGEENRESFRALRLKAKTIRREYALATKGV